MLRDRTPKIVIFALKWCKATEAWLDHVYKTWIWIFVDNKARLIETRRILGYKDPENMKSKKRFFKFADTIDWDNLNSNDVQSWKNISDWVSWFQENYAYIENAYNVSKSAGKDIVEIKLELMRSYLSAFCPMENDSKEEKEKKNKNVNNLCDFLINCFEDRI